MALVGGYMPKTMIQLPSFKPYKQRTGMLIILSCARSSNKPARPARTSGKPPQINRDTSTPLGSSNDQKQLGNTNKVIEADDHVSSKK
ncbi:hypothetical protein JRO89_XS06G0255700 [Xanthoceras sorbifolium]|uniref:Uncharacterized protein n=1 Tax=Xanthoceras sorbifolium TaxID=99658 RepID=A0ABQ8HZI5_9ROSI|nr:hypothetical protein JRO89_XS06G0255700 [Xanthoceras sorbifolium]